MCGSALQEIHLSQVLLEISYANDLVSFQLHYHFFFFKVCVFLWFQALGSKGKLMVLISCFGISEIITDGSKHFCHILSAIGYNSIGAETIISLTVLRSNSISGLRGVAQ